jgi:ribose/xylose/arabinose/galactoside ABC-type transport system permease subunit
MSSSDSRLTGSPSLLRTVLFSNEFALLVAIVLVVSFTGAVDSNHSYFTQGYDSLRDISRNVALLGIFALGAAVVIIAGGIDLSAGSTIAFCGVVCSSIMIALAPAASKSGQPVGALVITLAFAGTLLTGFFVGTLHTWLITSIRLPPFIATLATLVGLRSFARALCEYSTLHALNSKSSQIYVNDPVFTYLRQNVWVSVVVFLVLALVTWLVLSRTVLGRHLYALGGNEQASRLSGIRTENIKWAAYVYSAMTAAIAAIFYVANEGVAVPSNQARGHELNAIAAAVVGGCSLAGGIGTVPGTLLGAIFLRVVIDGVAKIIKTNADVYEGLIVGCVVVLAVTLTQLRQLLASGRQLFGGVRGLLAIPTLSITASIVALITLGPWIGLGVGVFMLVALSAVKIAEVQANRT